MLQERRREGQRKPDLELAFGAHAQPLTRLNAGGDQVEDWLTRRERYVRANSGQPEPPPPPPPREPQTPFERIGSLSASSSSGIGGTIFRELYTNPAHRLRSSTGA